MDAEPRAVRAFLRRLHGAVDGDRVAFTRKALDEADEDLGWLEPEMLLVLRGLLPEDFERREISPFVEGEVIWTFTPAFPWCETGLWIRMSNAMASS